VTEDGYRLADIRVMEFDDSVRERPGMYFGANRLDPRLATWVLRAVVAHAFHPGTRVAACHVPHVVAEVLAGLAFSVADDQAETLADQDVPQLGYYDSLLTPVRWSSAAAAALSSQTTVEVWRDGRGFRQRLIGARPVERRYIGSSALRRSMMRLMPCARSAAMPSAVSSCGESVRTKAAGRIRPPSTVGSRPRSRALCRPGQTSRLVVTSQG